MISKLFTFVRNGIFKSHIKKIGQHLNIGNSHLISGFKLNLVDPIKNKIYLTIGDDCMVTGQFFFESSNGEVKIGNRTFIGSGAIMCRSKIEIGDNVFIAWGGCIYDHDSHSIDYKERERDIERQLDDYRNGRNFIANKNWGVVNSKPITIKSNAWIGMNCTILKGVTIGEGAIVGAGSVVTRDVAPWTIVGGNPAQLIKEIPIELRKK